MRSQQEEAVDKYLDAEVAPMMRDIDIKRDANVLSSGCGDLTRMQMKVEFTDGMKETNQAKEIAQRIRMRTQTTRASVLIIARDYASSQGSFCSAYFRGNCQISEQYGEEARSHNPRLGVVSLMEVQFSQLKKVKVA